MKHRSFLIFILFLGSILIFPNLGSMYLYIDEVGTAMLAKNVLKYGYPTAWDGKNLIAQQEEGEFNRDHIWTLHPWLQ